MAEKNSQSIEMGPLALAIMVAAILFSAATYYAPPKTVFSNNPQTHVLSVSADAQQEVAPNKVEITFSVVSQGEDPSTIQADNDAKLRTIQDKLVAMGIPVANIKTVGYSLERWTEYNKTLETYVDRGYVLRNSLRVVSYDVEQAGSIVKEAVSNGANDVSGIQFSLSDSARKEIYGELLQQATADAKGKAESMASAAGVKIAGLSSMNEGYSYVEPMANYDYKSMAGSAGAPAPEVSISAGLVRVSATVSASYEVAG